MNWLAHLHLSEPAPDFRLGSILPDMVSRAELAALPPEFQSGIQRHWQIDAYTDSHPIFRRSVQRFKPPYRRYGGILVDVFYDHFLACHWDSFSGTPLQEFITEVYIGFEKYSSLIPEFARPRFQLMQAENWLYSYREIAGVGVAVGRIGKRLRRPVELAESIRLLESDYASFESDFMAFYPELQAHVKQPTPPAAAL